ncbi:Flp family type IVb pilin [Parvibacter caecicola]|uniref:Flp family type IVb pilin n=1 Tax=Parvibacter caecicola TaxID=747645 RepID=UPI003CCFECAF
MGAQCALRSKLKQTDGQGTTEYAILVGVLVVLAIVAITLFRPKLEELWNAIAEGINGL